jgi:hypothetical protein
MNHQLLSTFAPQLPVPAAQKAEMNHPKSAKSAKTHPNPPKRQFCKRPIHSNTPLKTQLS